MAGHALMCLSVSPSGHTFARRGAQGCPPRGRGVPPRWRTSASAVGEGRGLAGVWTFAFNVVSLLSDLIDRNCMATLTVKNVGPVRSARLDLKQVNVLIGPQSSGKSTLGKVACFCAWVEKQVALEQSFERFRREGVFIGSLVTFHKMEGYFSPDSEIVYCSPVVEFRYRHAEGVPSFRWVDNYAYVRAKISYIPAERNIVSLLADWRQVRLPDNNIFNFMSDWSRARKRHTPDNRLPISHLHAQYYYDEHQDADFLAIDDGQLLRLVNASSGQQSLTPLYVLLHYFLQTIYEKDGEDSVGNKELASHLASELFQRYMSDLSTKSLDELAETYRELVQQAVLPSSGKEDGPVLDGGKVLAIFSSLLSRYTSTRYSNLFVEEPELNLFPSTQKELLYHMVAAVAGKEHRLFVTTHSPYVLYALNNCLLGWNVRERLPQDVAAALASREAWIDPARVAVWQMRDGGVESVQEPDTGCIGKHYFNEVMGDIMDEYYVLLNYLDLPKP